MKEYPYWWDTVQTRSDAAAVPANQQSAITNRQYDVAIIGAGYTGLAAARTLARAGAAVIVCERERVGWGASSRNGGQVLTGLKLDPATLVERFGETRARRLFDASLASISRLEALVASESIDCEYTRTGHLQAAYKQAHFAAFREEQALLARVFGHQVELVPQSEQRSELGSDFYHGLSLDRRSSALNPARYVEGLAAAAVRAGAVLATGTSVASVIRRGERWIVTTGGPVNIDAGEVLFATNGYSNGAAPALTRRFVPVGSYIVATEPLEEDVARAILPQGRMVFDSKHFLYYFRLTADRRLLFGGRAEFSQPSPETTRRAAGILRQALETVFPVLAGRRIDYAWGGNVAMTRDQIPHAGRLDDGAYYAGGYCGHGIAMATELGEIIARRMGGEAVEHPLMDDRFPPIPFYHGRPWFLPVVGAYYRFLDAVH